MNQTFRDQTTGDLTDADANLQQPLLNNKKSDENRGSSKDVQLTIRAKTYFSNK